MTTEAAALSLEPETAERRPTFLAYYPRKLKLAVTFLLLAGAVTPFAMPMLERVLGAEEGAVEKAEEIAAHSQHIVGQIIIPAAENRAEKPHAEVQKKPVEPEAEKEADVGTEPAVAPRLIAISGPGVDAIRENDQAAAHLSQAPDDALIEKSGDGYLPKVAQDGRKPWQVYARPFNVTDPRPRIALVMVDMGLSNVTTMTALERLPPQVTLAFDAQSPVVASWLERARQMGHETLLSLPMEPADYPKSDPGPRTLLSKSAAGDTVDRMQRALRQGSGYVGVTSVTGTRLWGEDEKMQTVLAALLERGLMFLDTNLAPKSHVQEIAKERRVPVAQSMMRIDARETAEEIDAALVRVEQTARLTGKAVAIATPTPLTLDRLDVWFKQLAFAKAVALAPLTAVIE